MPERRRDRPRGPANPAKTISRRGAVVAGGARRRARCRRGLWWRVRRQIRCAFRCADGARRGSDPQGTARRSSGRSQIFDEAVVDSAGQRQGLGHARAGQKRAGTGSADPKDAPRGRGGRRPRRAGRSRSIPGNRTRCWRCSSLGIDTRLGDQRPEAAADHCDRSQATSSRSPSSSFASGGGPQSQIVELERTRARHRAALGGTLCRRALKLWIAGRVAKPTRSSIRCAITIRRRFVACGCGSSSLP